MLEKMKSTTAFPGASLFLVKDDSAWPRVTTGSVVIAYADRVRAGHDAVLVAGDGFDFTLDCPADAIGAYGVIATFTNQTTLGLVWRERHAAHVAATVAAA